MPSASPSLVERLFRIQSEQQRHCRSCTHVEDHRPREEAFHISVKVPENKGEVVFSALLDEYSRPEPLADQITPCTVCSVCHASIVMVLKHVGPYAFINANRIYMRDLQTSGSYVKRTRAQLQWPESGVFDLNTQAGNVGCQAIAIMKHKGKSIDDGHWESSCVLEGKWWKFQRRHSVGTGLSLG